MSFATAASQKSVWGFSPQSIPGLTWWLDGADATSMTFSSGSNITQWRDKSGNGFHATGVNSPQKISTGGVSFVASSSNYFTMGVTYSPSQTMFMVTSPVPSTSVNQYYINTNPGNRGGIFLGGYNSSFISYYNGGITNFASGTTTNPFVVSLVKVPGGTAVGNYNGGSQTFSVAANSADSATSTWAILGGAGGGVAFLTANIYEFIIFNVALPTTQIQQVEGYLAAKWGLTANLPATHPYSTGSIIPFNRPFYPTDIPGCSLWLDGGDRSSMTFSSGSNVSAWNDKSGTGNNFTGSATYALDSSFNTKFGLAFDGTNNYFNQASASVFSITNTTYCIFTAHHFTTNGSAVAAGTVYRTAVPNPGAFFRQTSGAVQWITDLDPAGYITRTATGESNSGINCINAITTTSVTAYLNGTSVGSSTKGSLTNMTFMIGQASGGLERLIGTIFEMIIFNNTLTDPQRQQVEQYLTWKWGLPVANLPTGHPGKLLPAFSTAFTPKSLTGLQLWLDGADTTSMTFSSGSNVSVWADKSGGSNATLGNPSYPATSVGSGMVFPVSNTYFSLSKTYTSTHTIYIVATPTSASQAYLFGRGSPNSEPAMIINFTGTSLEYYDDPDSGRRTFGSPTSTFVASYIRTPSVSVVGRLNGSQSFTEAGPTTEYSSVNWGFLGCASGAANWYTGTIYEFMIFSNALTTAQCQQVEGYLAWKWGLQSSLPSTHAYAKFRP